MKVYVARENAAEKVSHGGEEGWGREGRGEGDAEHMLPHLTPSGTAVPWRRLTRRLLEVLGDGWCSTGAATAVAHRAGEQAVQAVIVRDADEGGPVDDLDDGGRERRPLGVWRDGERAEEERGGDDVEGDEGHHRRGGDEGDGENKGLTVSAVPSHHHLQGRRAGANHWRRRGGRLQPRRRAKPRRQAPRCIGTPPPTASLPAEWWCGMRRSSSRPLAAGGVQEQHPSGRGGCRTRPTRRARSPRGARGYRRGAGRGRRP